jgi:hypothetical protein
MKKRGNQKNREKLRTKVVRTAVNSSRSLAGDLVFGDYLSLSRFCLPFLLLCSVHVLFLFREIMFFFFFWFCFNILVG